MRSDIRPLTPDDTLDRALELFVENDVMALPIVADLLQRKVIGMIRRQEIASAAAPRSWHGIRTVARGTVLKVLTPCRCF